MSEAYLEPSQIYEMEVLLKTVKPFKKRVILDIWVLNRPLIVTIALCTTVGKFKDFKEF